MRKITVDNIMAKKPCEEYPRERVEELWGGKNTLTLTEILDLDIPAEDRIWAVTRFLPKEENWQFARWCALQVTHLWDCPDVVKQYLETGDKSIRDAACEAAWNATLNAAWLAAWNAADAAQAAAQAAAWNAADAADAADAAHAAAAHSAAAHAAARGEERQKQIEKLREMLECTK